MSKLMVSLSPHEEVEQIFNYAFQLAQVLNLDMELVHHIDTGKKDWSLRYSEIYPDNLSLKEVEEIAAQERRNSIVRLIGENALTSNEVIFSVGKKKMKDALKAVSKDHEVEMALVTCDMEMTEPSFRESYRIVESLACPVWRIPLNPRINPVKTIVYATDFLKEDIEAIKEISKLAKKFSAKIIVLHVRKGDEYEEELKGAGLEGLIRDKVGYGLIDVQSMENSKVAKGINDFCAKEYADLIVFLRKDKGLLQELWRSDTIEKVIKTTALPVLVYHG